LAVIPPLSSGAGQAQGLDRQGPGGARQARAEAQRAFFQAALGRAQDIAAPTSRPQTQAGAASRIAPTTEDAPVDRIPRPGSIVNIVV
jgi:hypothetical protein